MSEPTTSIVPVPSEDSTVAIFSKWIIGTNGRIIPRSEAADKLREIKEDKRLSEKQLQNYVSRARLHLVREYGECIYNVWGQGWKLATDRETARHAVKSAKRVLKLAETTNEFRDITDARHLPEAIREIFGLNARFVARGLRLLLSFEEERSRNTNKEGENDNGKDVK